MVIPPGPPTAAMFPRAKLPGGVKVSATAVKRLIVAISSASKTVTLLL